MSKEQHKIENIEEKNEKLEEEVLEKTLIGFSNSTFLKKWQTRHNYDIYSA